MTIKSIQKVIKVGSSLAVTLPARDARAAGLVPGKEVNISVTPVITESKPRIQSLDDEYEVFKKQYGQTLKNLAQR